MCHSRAYKSFITSICLTALAGWNVSVQAADYLPPAHVSEAKTIADIKSFIALPDIPMKTGTIGYVEDIIRINVAGMDWDMGMSIHEPADPSKVTVGADGKKVGIFLLHGGSGDFKSMHKQANLLASKLGYKVISMSYPGRHAFHTKGRQWPGKVVTAYDHHKYSLEVRTPIWLRGEYITSDQYDVIKDYSQRPRYGIRTLAKAKPGTTFYYRMAAWPLAFEKGADAAMRKHFPQENFSIYLHGHSTGGPITMMLSQRTPNVKGILAIENSSFGYIYRAQSSWAGQLGRIDGYNKAVDEYLLPSRSDPFDELYIRSWRDLARIHGPEFLGQKGSAALMRLPMLMEDILEDWETAQKYAQFKAEYIITHGIEDSLREAAIVTAQRMDLGKEETEELIDHYIGLSRELKSRGVKPVPPVMFQITAHSRDHSREVYEKVVIPLFKKMKPAPKVSLTQFAFGTHGYISGEVVKGINLGVAPAVFKQWDDAIKGGFFD